MLSYETTEINQNLCEFALIRGMVARKTINVAPRDMIRVTFFRCLMAEWTTEIYLESP